MIRIVVTGGRDYRDADRVTQALDAVHRKHGIEAVIQGGADGADRLAAEWAWDRQIRVGTYNAQWRKYGKKAGPIRNEEMLHLSKPDAVVAFPGGSGTADCIARAKAKGIPVWEVPPR